ncbi:general negative regulator of transcription subunit 4 [Teratosphaeria destructans]|uniref:General negative regulator of transcription subunit 4 n=1 Tax=Teratosphaeria destructans TaxID=418781 RepID=A0A9W7SWV5_9PEZI|nr:general negative regulator of transcription subunit 4 [Teratosphaeria destructans]
MVGRAFPRGEPSLPCSLADTTTGTCCTPCSCFFAFHDCIIDIAITPLPPTSINTHNHAGVAPALNSGPHPPRHGFDTITVSSHPHTPLTTLAMSRNLQDQFIDDDEEETCPLCVEDLDLGDKGFRPCPCGYQICQFCYHNVKNNMNGLCPACRRPYRDEDIVYKTITPEETQAHKQRQLQKQKKTQQAMQKEKQKAEADHLSRKHLAGLRVVQKNLVYVTGLSPSSQEDQLLQTLRGDQYFGHPWEFTSPTNARKTQQAVLPLSTGARTAIATVPLTYEENNARIDNACSCTRLERRAKAIRERTCLPSMLAGSQQPVASAQPMARQASGDQPVSPAAERPALPSTASWASRPVHPSRAESRAASIAHESPQVTTATPANASQPEIHSAHSNQAQQPATTSAHVVPKQPKQPKPKATSAFLDFFKDFSLDDFKFVFSMSSLSDADQQIIKNYPPLFDENGGAKRRLRRQHEQEEQQRRLEEQARQFAEPPAAASEQAQDEHPEMSGSQQLGGEPEERGGQSLGGAIGRPQGQDNIGILDQRFQFGGVASPAGISDRGLTPQQHQQLLLNNLNQASAFQNQSTNPPGHQRNHSRFSFANDSSSASTSVKPVANAGLLKQQSAMMPQQGGFGSQQQGQFYTSNVQGPPPGLKTSGTPPVSGGMTFGQGHGFATGGLQYGAGATRTNANEEMMRNLLRGRDGAAAGIGSSMDQKREFMSPPNHYNTAASAAYPSVSQASLASYPSAGANSVNGLSGYGSSAVFSDGEKTGQRGKKKSKKHARQGHGNTSSTSSGLDMGIGAGINDAHLLQSRFQAGAAGGLGSAGAAGIYGPNGMMHGDVDFPALPPSRTTSVDLDSTATPGPSTKRSIPLSSQASLHQDDIISRRSTPTVPPGFEAHSNESRRGTPTVPPGFDGVKPTALPAYLDDEIDGPASAGAIGKPSSRPSSRTSLRRQASSQQILPALPLRPSTPAARPATPARLASSEARPDDKTPTKPSKGGKAPADSEDMKVAEKPIVAEDAPKLEEQAKPEVESTSVKGEDQNKSFENQKPAVPDTTANKESKEAPPDKIITVEASSKAAEPIRARKTSIPSSMQPASKSVATVQTSDAKASPVTPSKSDSKKEDSKRAHPGKLDITAAITNQQESNAAAVAAGKHGTAETPSKTTGKPAALAHARPESPSVSSPLVKNAPRTLRVVATPTPKSEMPPVHSAATPTLEKTVAGVSGAGRMPSRQPSVASMNIPGTPSSEHVSMSDNISMTSTSLSRANSPPPSKVGSAPVRTKTKNQMKKERQERAKQMEEEKIKAEAVKVQPTQQEEEVQEAIVSRQKKKKKEKEPKPPRQPKSVKEVLKSENTTPTASRPASPGQSKAQVQATEQMAAAAPSQASRNGTAINVGERMGPVPPPHMTPSPHNQDPSPPPTPTLTASALLAELKATAPEIQKCIDSLFRTPISAQFKPGQPITPKDLGNPAFWKQDFKINLTKDEVDALLKQTIPAVHYGGDDGRLWSRGMITGSGNHLRALTEELEQRFLELEDVLRGISEEGTFRSGKPQNEVRFPSVDLEALRRGFEGSGGPGQRGVSVMEQMVVDGGVMKKGAFLVDEASRYVNEFVMPPATPPPNNATVGQGGQGQGGQGQGVVQGGDGGVGEGARQAGASLEVVERQLQEAKRAAEESEGQLRKVIKRNKRVLGMG